jgi:murein L,D-transpeptidase YafK
VEGRKTVADRLDQYGEAARGRLLPHFEKALVPYPPSGLVFVGIKQDKKLEVWACGDGREFRLVRSYAILGASGRLGPKLREGDRQVPEGIYAIEWLNPNSKYHLSMRIGYPNEFDRARAKEEGRTNLGGDIMIHGGCASIGCLAVGDEAAEDLFVLAAETGIEKITVILTPVDFRESELPALSYALPEWMGVCYEEIKKQLFGLRGK